MNEQSVKVTLRRLAVVAVVAVHASASAQDVSKNAIAPQPASGSQGENGGADTAQQLSNPIASIISVPFQSNFDFGRHSTDKDRYVLEIEPVVPIALGPRLNLISRTIVPVAHVGNSWGLGDASESLFLSPQSSHGFTFGAGPVVLIPTATDRQFGLKQVGLGPTAVGVQQIGRGLIGLLANHLWSVSGKPKTRERLDSTLIQPFASYTLPSKTTIAATSEATYDWSSKRWTVPINVTALQLVKLGSQLVQFGVGPRYYASRPPGAARWGFRLEATLVYPVKH